MQSAGNPPLPRVDERRSGLDRRSGIDRRDVAVEEAATLPLERVFPHARLSDAEAAERAAAIEAHRRQLAARLGGDEFAIILPDTDAVAGLIVATRIRRNLVENASTMVTVSGGLVELPRDAMEASATQLMLVADHALYAAKNSGGNCVVQREYQSDE